jgi:hypothetical protein
MNAKRWFWNVLVILVALALIAAVPAAKKVIRIDVGQSRDVQIGIMGTHVANSNYTGYVSVSHRKTPPVTGEARLKTLERMISVTFKDLNGTTITNIRGTWYVYYNLTEKELKLFKDGQISLHYFDSNRKIWKPCYTFRVSGTTNRVACRMLAFGLYGLGYYK